MIGFNFALLLLPITPRPSRFKPTRDDDARVDPDPAPARLPFADPPFTAPPLDACARPFGLLTTPDAGVVPVPFRSTGGGSGSKPERRRHSHSSL